MLLSSSKMLIAGNNGSPGLIKEAQLSIGNLKGLLTMEMEEDQGSNDDESGSVGISDTWDINSRVDKSKEFEQGEIIPESDDHGLSPVKEVEESDGKESPPMLVVEDSGINNRGVAVNDNTVPPHAHLSSKDTLPNSLNLPVGNTNNTGPFFILGLFLQPLHRSPGVPTGESIFAMWISISIRRVGR
ncbi:hypothetical protein L2E82_05237 [Cichorium intybus]|uniref:Uncharacterized protein n=1 Tax=Cichorium intybus TaxID=13427 RepID=A0ACB9H6W1_CICIN|nr:hypothetical protein L2E82_05237 [Cichorium intybus]